MVMSKSVAVVPIKVLAAGSVGLNRRHCSAWKAAAFRSRIPVATGKLTGRCFFERATGIYGKNYGNFDRAAREFRTAATGISGIIGAGIMICSLSDPLDSMAGRMGFTDGVKYTPKTDMTTQASEVNRS